MRRIDLPFSAEMARAVTEGRKCCTSRRDLKGMPGDFFELEGARFRILNVSRERAADIALNFCRLEGFRDTQECREALHEIYPDLEGRDFLYVHFFARCP
jgi:hypothetical protein